MKVTFNSPVVLSYAFICTVVYFGLLQFNIGSSIFVLRPSFDIDSFTWYLSLFGYGAGHANADHLLGNMTFILLLGPVLEEKYGAKNLLIMMGACLLITAILHVAFFSNGLLGASGVVFMFII